MNGPGVIISDLHEVSETAGYCAQEKQSLSQTSTRPVRPCTIDRSFSYD
jgi:hypothetical protein